MEQNAEGSFSYQNWKASLSGQPWESIFEYPLFTDAYLIGEITEGFGPYQIINTVPIPNVSSVRPALILRVENHVQFDVPQMDKTKDENYHGGSEVDEIAALISLCLGIRLKAGGATR